MRETGRGVKTPWYCLLPEVKFTGTFIMKKIHKTKETTPENSAKGKPAQQPVIPVIVSDDRIGSNEPLDEANAHAGETPDFAAGVDEVQTSDHRVRKIEAEDEHTNEILIEEGLQGHMSGSLTKPRKTT